MTDAVGQGHQCVGQNERQVCATRPCKASWWLCSKSSSYLIHLRIAAVSWSSISTVCSWLFIVLYVAVYFTETKHALTTGASLLQQIMSCACCCKWQKSCGSSIIIMHADAQQELEGKHATGLPYFCCWIYGIHKSSHYKLVRVDHLARWGLIYAMNSQGSQIHLMVFLKMDSAESTWTQM